MKIGLVDVDGHNFPNLALMKLSAYHKAQGDSVEWYNPLFSGHMAKGATEPQTKQYHHADRRNHDAICRA